MKLSSVNGFAIPLCAIVEKTVLEREDDIPEDRDDDDRQDDDGNGQDQREPGAVVAPCAREPCPAAPRWGRL